jgi:hypothetical protein
VSLLGHGRCSWAGLTAWLAGALLTLAVVTSLVFGPELADRAWTRGVHVTPAQAAMHGALMAAGFAHHHDGAPGHASAGVASGAPTIEAASGGSSWGVPPLQAMPNVDSGSPASLWQPILPADQPRPAPVALAPSSPPPEAP